MATRRRSITVVLAVTLSLASLGLGVGLAGHASAPKGIHKIQHVIVVMQENRSFDDYFGTYPGADGIPMIDGRASVCIPDPRRARCVRPFHDPKLVDIGGPHTDRDALLDIDRGRMTGFIRRAIAGAREHCRSHVTPNCIAVTDGGARPDVVGWHDAREIPNYWTYAERFVLQDHLFEGVRSWSLPAHLDLVSGWSASCRVPDDPMSCRTDLALPADVSGQGYRAHPEDPTPYAWTDLTYLLHAEGVSWRYFVANGSQPDCDDDGMFCPAVHQDSATPDIWNPLPGFETVRADGQLNDVQPASNYFIDAADGALPAVTWIVPNERNSEHPPASIADGQAWVTRIVNAAMQRPRLEQHGDLPVMGRLGRLLRSRRPSRRERPGIRPARAGTGDQPVREERLRRPPAAVDRLLPAVHRGRFPPRRSTRPSNRRQAGRPAVRGGGGAGARRSAGRFRLPSGASASRDPVAPSTSRTGLRAGDVTVNPSATVTRP